MDMKKAITVQALINAPVEKVWNFWTSPEHITKWNQASADWHTTRSENDLRPGGKFSSRMEAKDGSARFDFWGIYDEVKKNEVIAYVRLLSWCPVPLSELKSSTRRPCFVR